MADVKICDRCGRRCNDNYRKHLFRIIKGSTLTYKNKLVDRRLDLCAECTNDLEKFLADGKKKAADVEG